MKKLITVGTLLLVTVPAFAASRAATIAAIKTASPIRDITEIRELSRGKCMDCFILEINGQGAFGSAYVKVQTERTGPNTIKTTILEQSR